MADTWTSMSVGEHLDAAGALFDAHRGDHVNGLHKDLIEATAHVQTAVALAMEKRSGGSGG